MDGLNEKRGRRLSGTSCYDRELNSSNPYVVDEDKVPPPSCPLRSEWQDTFTHLGSEEVLAYPLWPGLWWGSLIFDPVFSSSLSLEVRSVVLGLIPTVNVGILGLESTHKYRRRPLCPRRHATRDKSSRAHHFYSPSTQKLCRPEERFREVFSVSAQGSVDKTTFETWTCYVR